MFLLPSIIFILIVYLVINYVLVLKVNIYNYYYLIIASIVILLSYFFLFL